MDDARSPTPSIPPRDDTIYAYKPSMMGGPHAFRLGADALHWEIGRYSGTIPYASIQRIRLSFRPVTLATHRFMAEIWAPDTPKIIVASTSWKSMVEQQRQDAAYKAFIQALVWRIGRAGGRPLLQTGATPLLYWPGLLVCAGLAVGLPFMLFRAVQAGAFGGAAIVGLLLAVFVWQIGNFFWRNRPGMFSPDAVPPTVLPRG
jgi:hypothetical protein